MCIHFFGTHCIFFFSVLSIFCSIDFPFSTSASGLIYQPIQRSGQTRTKSAPYIYPATQPLCVPRILYQTHFRLQRKPRNCSELNPTPKPAQNAGSDEWTRDSVPIAQKAEWAPGPIWMGAEYLAPTGIRSLDRPPCRRIAIPTELSRPTLKYA